MFCRFTERFFFFFKSHCRVTLLNYFVQTSKAPSVYSEYYKDLCSGGFSMIVFPLSHTYQIVYADCSEACWVMIIPDIQLPLLRNPRGGGEWRGSKAAEKTPKHQTD